MWISQFICLDTIINLEGDSMRQNRSETIFSLFKSISVLIVFVISLVFGNSVEATSWVGPNSVPPLDNVPRPLNAGDTFKGDVTGKWDQLKISIVGCNTDQSLMWKDGSVVCGTPTSSASLLTVLNNGSDASAFTSGISFGSTASNWANFGGELKASWIHATGTGWNTFMGNVSIGNKNDTYLNPLSAGDTGWGHRLVVFSAISTESAEIDLQTGTGVSTHWGILNFHQEEDSELKNELRVWKDDGDGNPLNNYKLAITESGDVFAGRNMYAVDFCRYGGQCLDDIISGIGARFMGLTTSTYNGAQGGYISANNHCIAGYGLGSHVCTAEEILQVINGGTMPVGITDPAWISAGPPGHTSTGNDCKGWVNGTSSYLGRLWIFNQAYGAQSSCQSSYKFACCK